MHRPNPDRTTTGASRWTSRPERHQREDAVAEHGASTRTPEQLVR